MEDNKKITLEELKSGAEKEEIKGPTPEEIAAARATLNAQAYKERKMKEMKEQQAAEEAKLKEMSEAQQAEHLQKVIDGDEPALSTNEFFDSLRYDVESTIARKKYANEKTKEMIAEAHQQLEEEEELKELIGDVDEDTEFDYTNIKTEPLKEAEQEEANVKIVQKEIIPDEDNEDESDEGLQDISDAIKYTDDDYLDSVIDEEDEDDDEEDGLEYLTYTDEEYRKAIGKAASEKIKVIDDSKIIDLSKFTVSDRSMSVKTAVQVTHKDVAPNQANWGLFNSNLPILMEEFKSQELASLAELLSDESALTMYNRNRRIYQMIYDHDKSQGKPDTLEQWMKDISIRDNDNLYMAIYRASYAGANYIPYNCENCGYVFVSDNIPLEKMVKYATPEDEEKANSIIELVNRQPKKLDIRREQISEDYVMDFKDPSLYNIMLEVTLLNDSYVQSHQDLITYISYIESIYYINRETMQLDKINLTKYDANARKEIATKIKRYSKVLKELTQEQLETVQVIINEMVDTKNVDVNYVIPEITCQREGCEHTIPESESTAQTLVFMRQQLARFATMYQK